MQFYEYNLKVCVQSYTIPMVDSTYDCIQILECNLWLIQP
jgi:hypothetical protein